MITSHTTPVRVYYEDTDCGGVVYYANYLRYFERARTHHLEALGIDLKALTQAGQFFMVVRAEIAYHQPGRYGDTLLVESRIVKQGGASLLFDHTVRLGLTHRVLVTGTVRLASVDAAGRVVRFPAEVLAALTASA